MEKIALESGLLLTALKHKKIMSVAELKNTLGCLESWQNWVISRAIPTVENITP